MALTNSPKVGIVMGSISDWPVFQRSAKVLDDLGVSYDKRVLSAHRTPKELEVWIRECEEVGVEVFLAAAGGAAHLAGVIASMTIVPVLGGPMESNLLGLASLLSMVQMPGGIPVATVAIGGGLNAGLLAAQILAICDPQLAERLRAYRQDLHDAVVAKDARLLELGSEAYLGQM